jgi:hypothetical protein
MAGSRAGAGAETRSIQGRGASSEGALQGNGTMQGILYEEPTFMKFLFVTVIIGGGMAWMMGKGAAESWRTVRDVVLYSLLLGIAVRFIHHALFNGTMFVVQYYVVDTIILMALAVLGFLYTRTRQMTEKYYWLYEKSGPFSWKKKSV